MTLHVLDSLSAHHEEFLAVHRLRTPYPSPGSKWSRVHKRTTDDVRVRTPDDGQKGCPKQVVS